MFVPIVNGPATSAFSPLAIVVLVVKLLGLTLIFAAPPRLIVLESFEAVIDPSTRILNFVRQLKKIDAQHNEGKIPRAF